MGARLRQGRGGLARRKLAARDPALPRIGVDYAEGKTAIIREGTAVRAVLDGEAVTVNHNGRAALDPPRCRAGELARAGGGVAYDTNPAWRGVAVHYYDAYAQLGQ